MSETTPTLPPDPCVEYQRLKKILEQVATGQSVRSVRYRNGEEERQTDFHPGNVALLKGLVADARADCEASTNGGRPRRAAIMFSGLRRPYYGGM